MRRRKKEPKQQEAKRIRGNNWLRLQPFCTEDTFFHNVVFKPKKSFSDTAFL